MKMGFSSRTLRSLRLSQSLCSGVGMSSMRERAVELGGGLTVERGDGGGTVVVATLHALASETEAEWHWRRYLELDPQGPYAETAAARLAAVSAAASSWLPAAPPLIAPARAARTWDMVRIIGGLVWLVLLARIFFGKL